MDSVSFSRLGGACAVFAGIAGFLYAVAFIVVARTAPDVGRLLSALFLLLAGLLSTGALVAVYERLRETSPPAALLGLVLGMIGAMGATIHGGYDLAVALHPIGASADLPSQIDPRGLLTFGVTGLSLFVFGWLITSSRMFPHALGLVAYAQALSLAVLYLGRLIILSPTHPVIAVPALLSGFVLGPIWYIWLGLVLRHP
jgi:hypothetical protein